MRQWACLVLFLTFSTTFAQQPKPALECYNNGRYGFAVCYPPKLLVPQGESGSGDGQTFSLAKGQGTVAVWGEFGTGEKGKPLTLSEAFGQAVDQAKTDGFQIGYTLVKPKFFVLSGVGKGRIRYQKTVVIEDRQITLQFDYPEAMKPTMDSVVGEMSRSLVVGGLPY